MLTLAKAINATTFPNHYSCLDIASIPYTANRAKFIAKRDCGAHFRCLFLSDLSFKFSTLLQPLDPYQMAIKQSYILGFKTWLYHYKTIPLNRSSIKTSYFTFVSFEMSPGSTSELIFVPFSCQSSASKIQITIHWYVWKKWQKVYWVWTLCCLRWRWLLQPQLTWQLLSWFENRYL